MKKIAIGLVLFMCVACQDQMDDIYDAGSWDADGGNVDASVEDKAFALPLRARASFFCLANCTGRVYASCEDCDFTPCLRARLDCREACGWNCQTKALSRVYDCVMGASSIAERDACVATYCVGAEKCSSTDRLAEAYMEYFCGEGRFPI